MSSQQQQWILYNLAHANTRIKSPDDEAWIRILGFFNNKETALKYAKSSKLEKLEIRISPINEFRLLMKNTPNLENKEYELNKHTFLLNMHDKLRKEAFEETARNASERKMGNLVYNTQDKAQQLKEEYGIQETYQYGNIINDKLDSDLEQRMQKFCALALIPDYEAIAISEMELQKWEEKANEEYIRLRNEKFKSAFVYKPFSSSLDDLQDDSNNVIQSLTDLIVDKESSESSLKEYDNLNNCVLEITKSNSLKKWIELNPFPKVIKNAEPAIKFLYCGDTEEEIKKWILDNCNLKSNKNYDIACVTMYEWIRTSDAWLDNMKKTYREPELEKLHSNKLYNKLEALKLEGHVKEIEIYGGAHKK